MNVGRSERTPAKHEVLRQVIGQQVGAFPYAMRKMRVEGMTIIDATAGDGCVEKGGMTDEFSTPYINVRQLDYVDEKGWKHGDLRVHLIDRDPACIAQLRSDIDERPGLVFHEGDSRLIVPTLPRHRRLIVYIDDPNHSGSSTLDEGVVNWLTESSSPCTVFAAIGANVAGMSRLPGHYEESLSRYLRLLFMASSAQARFPRVPVLCRLRADASRWGYLTLGSAVFAEDVEKAYHRSMRDLQLRNGPYRFHAEPRIVTGYADVARELEELFTRRARV